MAKQKVVYNCTQCGMQFAQWAGQCGGCEAWNSLVQDIAVSSSSADRSFSRKGGYAGIDTAVVTRLADITLTESEARMNCGLAELDRVLGGGLVSGSVVLIGGDPGIGKSTVLLQTLCHLSQQYPALYITGEESLQQVTLRARRLGLHQDSLQLLAETQVERILAVAEREKPRVMVIDSIQTMFTETVQSAPGSVSQVRESAARLVHYAKQTGISIFLIGHVTKDGALAGPRVLEHMVDTVLYFESQQDSRFRIIRAMKNRFGAVNEIGVFAMTDRGLREVANPSALFLSQHEKPVSGSLVTVTWEGSRPLLVEIQALVDESHLGNPRRVTVGMDQNRLAMILAVLHRHGGIPTYDQDVFVNVVGGVRVMETAADLAVLLAAVSSLRNKPLPEGLVVFGEVGLSGEIRPVQSGQERLKEAAKHGLKHAIIPFANAPKSGKINGMEVHAVHRLSEALSCISSI
jgi:DNA repair protein RadA/Sms